MGEPDPFEAAAFAADDPMPEPPDEPAAPSPLDISGIFGEPVQGLRTPPQRIPRSALDIALDDINITPYMLSREFGAAELADMANKLDDLQYADSDGGPAAIRARRATLAASVAARTQAPPTARPTQEEFEEGLSPTQEAILDAPLDIFIEVAEAARAGGLPWNASKAAITLYRRLTRTPKEEN